MIGRDVIPSWRVVSFSIKVQSPHGRSADNTRSTIIGTALPQPDQTEADPSLSAANSSATVLYSSGVTPGLPETKKSR
jgi:hypothetical protein